MIAKGKQVISLEVYSVLLCWIRWRIALEGLGAIVFSADTLPNLKNVRGINRLLDRQQTCIVLLAPERERVVVFVDISLRFTFWPS